MTIMCRDVSIQNLKEQIIPKSEKLTLRQMWYGGECFERKNSNIDFELQT